jgi:hypothetical protein
LIYHQNIGFMTKSSKKIKRKSIKCKCLLVNSHYIYFKNNFASIKLSKYQEDLLLYFFYTYYGVMEMKKQMSTADELLVMNNHFF